mmetsp:Transcript_18774/g.20962  ORF Transcript_18774/g.20962 Transcript_18774/m.20962 type:complete len:92 (+) Transcript_18774:107-382(+)
MMPVAMMQPMGQPTVTPSVYGATSPVNITCPSCKNSTLTRTEATVSTMQWIIYIILYFFFPFCCCAPCYFPSCFQVKHVCSTCNHFIGVSQ